ncbi:MAG: histidine kinase [Hyphomicrobiaceae bacterium]|nr:histidine kinase [Hyphomicrobiaceae bacterium]
MALAMGGCGSGGGVNPFAKASGPELIFISAAQTWDMDRNNVVTCDEWKRYTAELFAPADRDGDGALTAEEYKQLIAQDRLFEAAGMGFFDMNGDGKVSREELAGKPNPAFTMLDRDKDCQLTSNEMVQTRQIDAAKPGGSGQPNIGGAGGPGGVGRP